jgi:hypothetical protein
MRSASALASASSARGARPATPAPSPAPPGHPQLAGEAHLGGPGVADHPLQQPRAAVAGDQPQLHEALGEAGLLGGDADVGHAGQVAAGADGRAIDGGDGRHVEAVEGQRNALDAAPVVVPHIHPAARRQPALVAEILDVAAGAEGAAGTGEDHHLHRRVGLHPLAGGHHGVPLGLAGERIAGLGGVEGERDDGLTLLEKHEILAAHGFSLLLS